MPDGIPFSLWKETIDHINEPKKVAALGRRAYEAFYGSDVSSHGENLELLRILAGLLCAYNGAATDRACSTFSRARGRSGAASCRAGRRPPRPISAAAPLRASDGGA